MLSNYVPGNYPNIDNPSALGKYLTAELQKISNAITAVNQAQPNTGIWTPVDASGAGLALSGVSAEYTQIGNLVFAYCEFVYPATASGLNAVIGGLPFKSANAQYAHQGRVSYSPVADFALVDTNSTTFKLYTSAGASVTNSAISATTFDAMLIYPVT